ncbi:glycosyltransferase family 2 protein [Aquirufa aurantiipilula]|uniref:glycosyltransferase family 2 protein n=1 Tax=Aquirufa aurantiipilula TaxID=2696561 RepID=UPI001CAA4536|nr:glycosyltransferase family 2 protein [Aquirufa aurantiipilula]MBZ1326575.1 glycosyltransferase family 2 protein [Aquirufa aurantiipilula]
MPLISIIVTTYNRELLLKETILSILAQSIVDFELIVVDNFSNYDFLKFMSTFNDKRIKSIQNQNNGIIAVNRNAGIQAAQGKYLAFCDDDDLWESNKLELQLPLLESNSADLVYSGTLLFNEFGMNKVHCYQPVKSLAQFFGYNPVTLSSVILRNSNDILFDENIGFAGIEDYTLWINLWMRGLKFHMIEKPLVKFRVSNTSFSSVSRSNNEYKIIKFKMSLFAEALSWKEKLALKFFTGFSIARFILLKLLNR